MRRSALGLCFVAMISVGGPLFAADLTLNGLRTTYAVDARKCEQVLGVLAEQKICRPYGGCNNPEEWELILNGRATRMFKQLAVNEYGYTEIQVTTTKLPAEYEVLYINQFQGDRQPRLLETYKVSRAKLQQVLTLPPGPMAYEQWNKLNPRHPKDTNAVEFAALLQHGEKLTSEWSPVVNIGGEFYVFERECAGSWGFGGHYGCARIIKLTAKKLFNSKRAVPYCQMTRVATASAGSAHDNSLERSRDR